MIPDDEFVSFLAVFYTQAIPGMLIAWARGKWNIVKDAMLENMLLMVRKAIPALMDGRMEKIK